MEAKSGNLSINSDNIFPIIKVVGNSDRFFLRMDLHIDPRLIIVRQAVLHEYEARSVLQKYCSFMPTEIYLSKEESDETQTIDADEKPKWPMI